MVLSTHENERGVLLPHENKCVMVNESHWLKREIWVSVASVAKNFGQNDVSWELRMIIITRAKIKIILKTK